MAQIFFFFLFMLMLPPTLLSIALASRHWIVVLWNGFWYMILAEVAVRAFDTPNGKYVGLFFLCIYLYRVILKRPSSVRFQVHNLNNFGPQKRTSFSTDFKNKTEERVVRPIPDPFDGQILEGEYKRLDKDTGP